MKRLVILCALLAMSGAALAQLTYLPMTKKVVTVCASGCRYTTLNAACAAQTSTAANPIEYSVGPGLYSSTSAISCSGETDVKFTGAGQTATKLVSTQSGAGDYGTLELGTSLNVEISGMSIKGHRAIYAAFGATGGGNFYVHDAVLESPGVDLDEDCAFMADPVAGSSYIFENVHCKTYSDGLTNKSGNPKWFVKGNHFTCGTPVPARCWAYSIAAQPSMFVSEGDTFDMTASVTGASAASVAGYVFQTTGESGGGGCTSNCKVYISGADGVFANTDANGDIGAARAVAVEASQTGITVLQVRDSHFTLTTTDATAGNATAILAGNNNASMPIDIFSSQIETSGGITNTDINGQDSTVSVFNTKFATYGSDTGLLVVGGNQRMIQASEKITLSDAAGTAILLVDNTDEGQSEVSPQIRLCNATVAAGEDCGDMIISTGGSFRFRDGSANIMMQLNPSGTSMSLFGDVFMNGTAPTINMAAASATISTGAFPLNFSTLATAPATCSIGAFYVDTSGAYCACTATNTWSNMTATGTCA